MSKEHQRQKRQFWIILTIVFLGFVGISVPYLIFPSLFLNPGYSILPEDWGASSRALFLGITLAAYPLGQFIGSPVLGSLSDEYGRKPLMWISLLIAAFCNLLSGLAIDWQHLGWLIISRFMAGLMEGNIAIARAMAADLQTLSKHKTFGKINAAASIAFLLGPLLGGLMTDPELFHGLTTSTPFYFICLLFFALAALSALVLTESATEAVNEIRSFWERIHISKRISKLFSSNPRLQFLMLTSTSFTLAVDIFYEFGPVYLTTKWALNPSDLIIYNGMLCLTLAIGNGWLPGLFSTRPVIRTAIIASIGGLALCLLGMILVNSSPLMLLLFGLAGLVIGLAVTLLTVKISDSVSNAIQGEVMGVQLSLRVLGDACICLLGGVLLMVSSKLILIVAAIISAVSMVYYLKNL